MAFDSANFKGPNGVNVAEILRVADLVEKSTTFDMGTVFHDCGTPACIAGHILGRRTNYERDHFPTIRRMRKAARVLGLSDRLAANLFVISFPNDECTLSYTMEGAVYDATPAHAAACLRKLAETGEVDWLGTKPGAAS